jgi:hypothetical protein
VERMSRIGDRDPFRLSIRQPDRGIKKWDRMSSHTDDLCLNFWRSFR